MLTWKNISFRILDNISGYAKSNTITAIMGPSGSGKSTLLEALAKPEFDINYKKKSMAFVNQKSEQMETLTVHESLLFHCKLQGNDLEKLHKIIDEVLLTNVLNQLICNISGGERKRLDIAQCLITQKQIILLDEPITSLDSAIASIVMDVIDTIKNHDKILICSIHQPNSNIFFSFDSIYVLNKGELVYHDSPTHVVDYCLSLGEKCPMYTNPADFLIEMVYESKLPALLVTGEEFTYLNDTLCENNINVSLFKQFQILLQRAIIDGSRQPMITKARIIQALTFGFLIGSVFFNTDSINIEGCVFFILINQMFSIFFSVVQTFPLQLRLFQQEYNTLLYLPGPYYWAKTTSDIGYQLVIISIFCSIVLPMTNICTSASSGFQFLGTLLIASQVFSSFGYFVSTLSQNPVVTLILGNMLMLPALLISTLFIESPPSYYIFLEKLSTFNYANNALLHSINYESNDPEPLSYHINIMISQAIVLRMLGHIVLSIRCSYEKILNKLQTI